MQTHPKGARARVLLSSVFGPYAQDDEFGSRSINPMELYHNQVTRAQGAFSLRMFHRSWGIMMIQANISAPTTVLDFPTREAFERELREHDYDIVGITSIIVNVGKVREMCRMVREISPRSTIVVGGHVTAIPTIETMIDADFIVRGEGISWMRRFLGLDDKAPIVHPAIVSGFGHRVMGLKLPFKLGSTAATIVPSVGCPMGCNFCTTSAFFGGKGKVLNFYNTGEELYGVMSEMEGKLGVSSFFVMDENFLLNKRRAMELLAYMKRDGKSWEFYVFSSANAIAKYTMDELVELGISWVWMGLESPKSGYSKLDGVDTLAMTGELRQHGILEGVVTNVTKFGAFIDIGVHQDGLVHISELSNRFIKYPSEAVKAGQIVKVKVLSTDAKSKRIALSMKALMSPTPKNGRPISPQPVPEPQPSLSEKLAMLSTKWKVS